MVSSFNSKLLRHFTKICIFSSEMVLILCLSDWSILQSDISTCCSTLGWAITTTTFVWACLIFSNTKAPQTCAVSFVSHLYRRKSRVLKEVLGWMLIFEERAYRSITRFTKTITQVFQYSSSSYLLAMWRITGRNRRSNGVGFTMNRMAAKLNTTPGWSRAFEKKRVIISAMVGFDVSTADSALIKIYQKNHLLDGLAVWLEFRLLAKDAFFKPFFVLKCRLYPRLYIWLEQKLWILFDQIRWPQRFMTQVLSGSILCRNQGSRKLKAGQKYLLKILDDSSSSLLLEFCRDRRSQWSAVWVFFYFCVNSNIFVLIDFFFTFSGA